MAITHLDDLPVDRFIAAIKNLSKMTGTEKLDGASLWVGVDESGKLFTSREGKRRGKRFYKAADFANVAAHNQFRAAHTALEKKAEDIKRLVPAGAMVELEVLHGRQPNTVTYGAGGLSYIAILRPVEGTSAAVVQQLANALDNTEVTVTFTEVGSADGHQLDSRDSSSTFRFTKAKRVDLNKLADLQLDSKLQALEDYLLTAVDGDVTAGDLVTKRITEFPKDEQERLKKVRAEVLSRVRTEFKLPIKRELLDELVSGKGSTLTADDTEDGEHVGIEGIVFEDPNTGELVKLVDKDAFTTVNLFNQAMRGTISGLVRTTDPDAPIEARGGLIGTTRLKIAETLGNIDLARTAGAKRALENVRGKDANETVNNLAKAMGVSDYQATKRLILRDISLAAKALAEVLDQFKQHQDGYRLTLKDGRTVGLSKETVKQTLAAFAEGRQQLQKLFDGVKQAKTLPQLLATLYGQHAVAIFAPKDEEVAGEVQPGKLQEGSSPPDVLLERRDATDRNNYKDKDAWTVMNTYLATLFTAFLIIQVHDVPGIRQLRDKPNYRLRRWDKGMSLPNFWGYPVWRSTKTDLKKLLGPKVAGELFRWTRRVPDQWWKFLHMDVSFGKDTPINWADHDRTLKLLLQASALNTNRLNRLLSGAITYQGMTLSDKMQHVQRLYMYAQQFIPGTQLFMRLRTVAANIAVNASGQGHELMEHGLLKLLEDGETGNAGAASQAGVPLVGTQTHDVATTSSSIAALPTRLFKVEKRKRNKNLSFKMFARPTGATK
jgi:hypothetical protein